MSDERCKRGHLIAKVGKAPNNMCAECKRQHNREYQRRRYHEDPEFRQRTRRRKQRWLAQPGNRERVRETDAAWRAANRERVREYGRMWAEGQRREAGASVRTNAAGEQIHYGRSRPPQGPSERVLLPADPFTEWLKVNVSDDSVARWSRAHDIEESLVRKIRDGRQALVHIDTVDRVAVRAGLHLSAIYPELYEVAA